MVKRERNRALATRVSPVLHGEVLEKQKRSGIAIAEVLRRALRLWVRGELEELLPTAGE